MDKASPAIGTEQQSDQFTVSSRRMIARGADVQVKEFLLRPGEDVPWHHHSEVFDVFYCLQGTLTVEAIAVDSAERLPDVVLLVGESVKLEPGTAHHPVNRGASACRFVLVQGVGKYDFLPFPQKNTPA